MPEGDDDQRAAVLATVERFFGDPDAPVEETAGGVLLDWLRLEDSPWREHVAVEYRLERATIRELTPERAVVDVAAAFPMRAKRGSWAATARSDGPAMLERIDGSWRVVDYALNGQSRLSGITLGLLAAQTRDGATMRVVGLDRHASGATFAIELENTGDEELRVEHAYGLVEADAMWTRMYRSPDEPVAPGARKTFLLRTQQPIPLSELLMAVAVDVRSRYARLPFLLRVPPAPPAEVEPQRPPQRLPHLRRSWPRNLLFWAAATAGIAWWLGWVALLVPIFVALNVWWQYRVSGHLPERAYRLRHLLDLVILAGAFLLLWETPDVLYAASFAVGVAAYLLLYSLRGQREGARAVTAATLAVCFFFLFGRDDGRFSACRIAGGSPAAVADRFVRAAAAGDLDRVRSLETGIIPREMDRSLLEAYAGNDADAVVATRRNAARTPACRFEKSYSLVTHCYSYAVDFHLLGKTRAHRTLVTLRCWGRDWRVHSWS